VQYVLKLLIKLLLSTTNSYCFSSCIYHRSQPVGKFVTVASVALPPRCKTVVVIAVPEHTVGLVFQLVNTIVEARLRVTVPDIVAALYTVQYVPVVIV
jgi:hypothetical protein